MSEETPNRTPGDLARLQAFRARLETILPKAIEAKFAPLDIAGAFFSVGLTVLVKEFKREDAVAYLRELANEIEETGTAPDGVILN